MRVVYLLAFIFLTSFAAYAQESNCSDGIDNDGDGFIDCFDGDCANVAACNDSYIGKDKLCQDPPQGTLQFGMTLAAQSPDRSSLSYGRMAVGDLDRDGIPEMVTVHTDDKKVFILNGNDLTVKKEINTIGNPEYFDHAIANLDDDNCAEIFIVESEVRRECDSKGKNCKNNTYYMVTSFDCNGAQLWRTEAYGRPFTIGLADFDQDGQVELYYKNEILDAKTGDILVKGSGNWNSLDSGPVAVDILPDGACGECAGLELVLGGEIYAVDLTPRTPGGGSVGTPVKRFNDLPNRGGVTYYPKYVSFGYVNSMTSIADYNLDGNLDVVMNGATSSSATSTTTVFFWDVTNNTFKTYQPKQPNNTSWAHGTGRINLADVDGDGKMNATFVSGARIYSLKEDFTLLWQKTITEQTSGFTSTTVFDFNNDNAVEIVYRDESNLYIIDGKTGNAFTTVPCRSRTANDYPIVVDVDADGATEICVSCATNDNTDINDNNNTPYGQIRTYKSSLEPWVSARKVWNQYAYFNVNVNDDLTIPRVQQKHHLVFSEDVCGTGQNRALNSFLNQSAILDSKGCKTYPSADVAFVSDPDPLIVKPPTCPDQTFLVTFTLKNIGDLNLNGTFPITFYNGDPRLAGAEKLSTESIPLTNFRIGDEITITDMPVTGTGGFFTLFAVLNDAGTSVPTPISLPNSGFAECNFSNNIVSASVRPVPFALNTASTNHVQCGVGPSPPSGSARAFKPEGGNEQTVGYTFYWFDGSTSGATTDADHVGSQVTGLTNGAYSVYAVHNAYQCGSDTVTVNVGLQSLSIAATVAVDKPYTNCNAPDGQLSVTPSQGSIDDYTYEWFEGTVFGTSQTLSDSSVLRFTNAATYSVLVTQKSSGCETLESGTVPDLTVTPEVSTAITPALCSPANSGQVAATVGGVTNGYTFYWYDGTASLPTEDYLGHTYTNVPEGSYTVVARDNTTGCRSNETVVSVPTVAGITVTASVTAQQTSCTIPNGAASANVAGSTTGYSFKWFEGNNTISEIGTGHTMTELAAGTYTVEATSLTTGCKATTTVTINESLQIPTINASVVANQLSCLPANGAVTALASGSPGPYKYYWFDGNVGTPDTTSADYLGADQSGLVAGVYTVVAVDVNSRCGSARAVVEVLDQTTTPAVQTTPIAQTSCDPATPNGGASANVGGSVTGYRFRWFAGSDTTTFISQGVSMANRAAGTYTVKAQNIATGCFATTVVLIDDNAETPTLSLAKQDNGVCTEDVGFTGSVTSTLATSPNSQAGDTYIYEWRKNGTVITGETGASITGLDAGTYSVTVTNQRLGCVSDPVSIVVNDAVDLPTIVTTSTASTNCVPELANGSAAVVSVDNIPAAGLNNFTFQWHTGGAPISTAANATAEDPVLTGVQGGVGQEYTVLVTNLTNGCSSTAQVNVSDAKILPELTLATTPNSICDPALTDPSVEFDGTVTATVDNLVGAVTDYTFALSGGSGVASPSPNHNHFVQLNGGISYTVTATHTTTGCVSTPASIQVTNDQIVPVITTASDGSTNCIPGVEDGIARVVTVDGNPSTTAGYTFAWTGPAAFPVTANATRNAIELEGVQGGTGYDYTVLVTNLSNGCQNTAVVNVADVKQLPALSLAATPNSICDPSLTDPSVEFNGTLTATVTNLAGSLGNYSFALSGGSGVQDNSPNHNRFLQLNGGITYSVTATHTTTGCVSTPASIQVTNDQSIPVITTASDGSTNCVSGLEDGAARVVTVDGNPATTTGFAFSWTGPASFPVSGNATRTSIELSGVQGGTGFDYTVLVTNLSNGCQNTAIVNVADEKQLPMLSLSASPNSICDPLLTNPSVEFNGTLSATVTNLVGALADYTFALSGGTGVQDASPNHNRFVQLDGGISYSVTATHTVTGCVSTPSSIQVQNDLQMPVVVTDSDGSTNCDPDLANGVARVTTVDGNTATTTGYTFEWTGALFDVSLNPTRNSVELTDVQGGAGQSYAVLVTNLSSGCQTTVGVSVADEKVLPSISLAATANTICDPDLTLPSVPYNGAVSATVNNLIGVLTDYTFAFSGGAGSQGTSPLHNTFNNLNGEITYSTTATHLPTGCVSDVSTVYVPNNVSYPTLATSADGSTNCDPALPNGVARLDGVDGVTPVAVTDYTFQWYNGIAVAPANIRVGDTNTIIGSTTPGAGLQGGASSIVTVLVTRNADGCQNTASVTVPDLKANPVVTVSLLQNNTICDPLLGANGSLGAAVTYKGVSQTLPAANWVITWSTGVTGETLTALAAGTYSAIVTDTNTGCVSGSDNGTVVDQFDIPVISTNVLAMQTSCDPAFPNGQLEGLATNGPVGSTLRYRWYDGIGTSGTLVTSASGQASGAALSTLPELASRDYTFEARNEVTGCTNLATILLPQQLTYPQFAGNVTSVTSCVPTNGEIDITLTTITDPTKFTIWYLDEVDFAQTGAPSAIKAGATLTSSNAADLSYVGIVTGQKLIPGTYTVLVRDDVTHCESDPETFTVHDNTNKTVTVSATVEASACNSGVGGEIDISVSPAGTYGFEWYAGVPTNTDFDFMNNANLPAFNGGILQTDEDLNGFTDADAGGVGAGLYTVVVRDPFGCGKVFTETVPYVDAPVVTVTSFNSTQCDPASSDARVQVEVTGTPGLVYSVALFAGHHSATAVWVNGEDDGCKDGIDNDNDGLTDTAGDSDCGVGTVNTVFTQTSDALTGVPSVPLLGDYLIRVHDPAGSGCNVEKVVTLKIDPKLPVVSAAVTPNTACVAGVGDGTVEITVNKQANDPTTPSYELTLLDPVNHGGSTPQVIPTGVPTLVNGTFDGRAYTLTVTDVVSGCAVDKVVNVPSQPLLPTDFVVTATSDEYCAPLTGGSAVVNTVLPGTTADYTFEWYRDNALTTLVTPVVAGGGGTGELLTSAEVIATDPSYWPINTVNGRGNGNKTFYVRAQKQGGPGDGCYTPVVQVTIEDTHVAPALTLLSFPNTSCGPVPEGRIQITSTTSSATPAIAGALYTYSWNPVTPASPVNGIDGAVPYLISGLDDDTYTVVARNEVNGCVVENSTTVEDTKFDISITDRLVADQELCPTDGRIDVTEIKMNRSVTGESLLTFTGADLSNDFTYQWFRAASGNPAAFDPTSPLTDNASHDIDVVSLVAGTAAGEYPSMGFGTYYVIATRTNTAGLPGALCASTPLRVEVADRRVFPVIAFDSQGNTSCNNEFDGRITVTASSAGFPVGTLYDFNWTTKPAAATITDRLAATSASVFASEALGGPVGERIGPGSYAITVTNTANQCATSGQVTLQQNSVPVEVVSATSTALTHCAVPDGTVTVGTVSVNGTNAALGDFTFAWTGAGGPYAGTGVNNLTHGDYFVTATKTAATAPASGCASVPFKVSVVDDRRYPVISFATLGNTACNNEFDGEISVTALTNGFGLGTLYDFAWTGSPAGSTISDRSGVAAPAVFSSEARGGQAGERVGPGSYAITVTNNDNQCASDATVSLQQISAPVEVLSATSTALTHCAVPDGTVTVTTVNVNGTNAALGDFAFAWTGAGGPYAGTNVNNLTHGDYFVTATKTAVTAPASGCASAPFKVKVADDRRYPAVSFATLGNTACNNEFDGQISVTALTNGFGPGTLYDFAWTGSPVGSTISNRTGVPAPAVFSSEALGGQAGERIGPGSYAITVTNNNNQCASAATVSLQQISAPVEVLSATSTALTHCAVPDGTVTVTTVNVNGTSAALGDFAFAWTGAGGPYAGASVNNLIHGDYFVTARKTAVSAPASGCESAPFKVTVADDRRYPTISFATLSSTACDNEFDGRITVTAETTGFAGALYDFDWTSNPVGTTITDRVGVPGSAVFSSEAVGGPVGERIGPGSYAITVTNASNMCFSNGLVVLQRHTVPVEILTATSTPQQICDIPADGSVSVALADVRVDGQPVPSGITFAWTNKIGNGIGAGPSVFALNAGVYAVRATRTSGIAPASGCVSAPVEVEVEDHRQYPVVNLVSAANTTCHDDYDAEIKLTATTSGLGAGASYDIVWTNTPGGFTSISNANNIASPYTTTAADNIGVGSYAVTVTNTLTHCSSDAVVTVIQKDVPLQILNVVKVDQRDCAPFDGSISIDTNDPSHISLPGAYSFEWEKAGAALNPVPDNMMSGLNGGVYTLTGMKTTGVAAGCATNPFSVTILDLTVRPTIELNSVANFACDPALANGQISALLFEGTGSAPYANYLMEWFAGKNVTTGTVLGTTHILANQEQGDYTFRVVDQVSPNRGCENIATLPIAFNKTTFTVDLASADQTLCAPGQDGRVDVTGITETLNGVSTPAPDLSAYTFQWFDETGTPHVSTPVHTAGVTRIENLLAGGYYVRVRNALGCESPENQMLVKDLTVLPVITLEDYLNPVVCVLPAEGGYLQVSADNSLNFADYRFEWFEGADDSGTLVEPNNPMLADITYDEPLKYTVRVTNLNTHCVNRDTYLFRVDTANIQVMASAVARTSCLVDDGSLFATTLNGTGALYNYEWYEGPAATGVPVYTTKEVANVPIGQYTVIAVNPNHSFCQSNAYTTRVTDGRVLPPVVAVQRNPLTYCDPANPNGVAFASVNNDVTGHTFEWFKETVVGSPFYTGPEVTGLTATTYVVRATDVITGCENTASLLIENKPLNIDEPAITILSHLTNCVNPDGALQATVNGTTLGYLLQWYDGKAVTSTPDYVGEFYRDLDRGFYTVTAKDKLSGCVSDPVMAEILPFQELPDFDIKTVPTNCEENIGEATLVMNNGVQVYTIEWHIGYDIQFGSMLSDLPKGEFSVIVTTFQQCSAEKSFVIRPDVLVFNGISRNNDGQNDYFEIACIQDFPNNNVKIFNRAGTLVYEANGYDNQDVFFDGVSNRGISLLGNDLPDGTYFYIIDKRDGSEPKTGYLELLR